MATSTPALVIASFALGWYAAYVLLGVRTDDTVPTEQPSVLEERENAALKRQVAALRQEVDELSRRIIETAFVEDEDDAGEGDTLLKPLALDFTDYPRQLDLPPSTPGNQAGRTYPGH